jgi:hypothetical protein
MADYLKFGISISFISWLVGLIGNGLLMKMKFYHKLSNFNFIESTKMNRYLGIKYFQWIVKNTPFKFFNQKIKLKNGKADLMEMRKEMTYAEIGHLIGFVFVLPFAAFYGIKYSALFGLIIMAVNVLMNLYPSLLQQENKRRIDRLIRLENLKAKAN